ARALAQLFERAAFLLRGPIEVAIAQRPLRPLHRFGGAAELFGGVEPDLAHPLLQPAQHVAQLAPALAQGAHVFYSDLSRRVARLTRRALARAPALRAVPLALRAAVHGLARLALLTEGVIEQLLLTADDVAELVHHLAELAALALVGHAAGL